MKLIAEIQLNESRVIARYRLRKAARCILWKGEKIALIHVVNKHIYKLPGGGIENGEDIPTALKRELLEETGCEANIIEELGSTIEYRNVMNLIQVSYVYVGFVSKDNGKLEYTDKEKAEGCELVWVEKDKVLNLVEQSQPDPADESAIYMVARDAKIVRAWLRV